MRTTAALIVGALVASAGCRHLDASEDVPAVLVSPTSAVRTELSAALAAALGTTPTLADDALTRTSVLVIERARPREPALTGRIVDAPVHRFELVVNDERCALVRPADGWRAPLPSATCRPE